MKCNKQVAVNREGGILSSICGCLGLFGFLTPHHSILRLPLFKNFLEVSLQFFYKEIYYATI